MTKEKAEIRLMMRMSGMTTMEILLLSLSHIKTCTKYKGTGKRSKGIRKAGH